MPIKNEFPHTLGAVPLRAPIGRRPTAQYIALVALLVIAVAYQIRILEERFPHWFGASLVQWGNEGDSLT